MDSQVNTQSSPQIFEREYYQRLYDIEEKHWWAQGMRDAMVALLHQPYGGCLNRRSRAGSSRVTVAPRW